jgi:hypothetical protein
MRRSMSNVTEFEPVAWWWTRNQIGRSLRERYEAPTELPSQLLALVRKLDAVQANSPGQEN